jgi:hypothetical protein
VSLVLEGLLCITIINQGERQGYSTGAEDTGNIQFPRKSSPIFTALHFSNSVEVRGNSSSRLTSWRGHQHSLKGEAQYTGQLEFNVSLSLALPPV